MCKPILFLGTLVSVLAVASSARILGVFPMPSLSHQLVFRSLTLELAKRGHEVVVITTDPAFTDSKPPSNYTEVDLSSCYQTQAKVVKSFSHKRGVLREAAAMANFGAFKNMVDLIIAQMEHPNVKKLLEDENRKFDLIIAESFFEYQLVFSEIYKAPVILISSFHGFPENYEILGGTGRHPYYYPHVMRQNFGDLTLLEKLEELRVEYKLLDTKMQVEAYENEQLKAKFGLNTPTVQELYRNVQFLLINSNELYCSNRPIASNIAYVGPLHLQTLKPLPQDLKSYLDNSTNGVIYVSLGTNVQSSSMDKDLLDAFVDTFEDLPYDILWKFDGDLNPVPSNIRIQKWFPQRDLLKHPKVKLFVTQGGLQSADEAIDAGVPLVIIPMLGDQYYNAHKFEQLGIGVKLDGYTLNAASLIGGIKRVLNENDSYKRNVQKLRNLIHDHPQTGLERAVWWTEYVLRHGGAEHLRPPHTYSTWAEFLMLDLVLVLLAVVIVSVLVLILGVKYVLGLFRSKKIKVKSKLS